MTFNLFFNFWVCQKSKPVPKGMGTFDPYGDF